MQLPCLLTWAIRVAIDDLSVDWKHVVISTLGQNNHAVGDERWRYIQYAEGSEELYDHKNNSNEWINLAVSTLRPEYAKVIKHLRLKLPQTNLPQRKGKN